MSAHAEFSPSSGKRVVLCTASFKASKGEPNPTNEFAAEGSGAHFIGENVLREGLEPSLFLGLPFRYPDDIRDKFDPKEKKFDFVCDEEMVACVKGYRDYCLNIMKTRNNARMFVEQRVNISQYTPIDDQFGTSDCIIASRYELDVVDLKYGKREIVMPKENIQGILYALGAYEKMRKKYPNIKHITIHIYQPRVNNISSWRCSVKKLKQWGAYILERFTEAWNGGEFTPGEVQCRYCLVQAKCKAYAAWWDEKNILAAVDYDEEVDEFRMTVEEIAEIWKLKSLYEARFRAIHAFLFKMLNGKEDVPGLKLADGKGSRFWKRPRAAAKMLEELGLKRDALYTESFVSPAQAEKMLTASDRKKLARLIGKKPGNPRIVDVDSNHIDYEDSLTRAFDNLDA